MIQMFDRSKKFICQVHNLVQTFGCTVLFKCILTLNCSACSWVIAGFLGHVCVAVCKLGTCSQDLQPVMDNRPAMVKPHFILDDVLPWWGGGEGGGGAPISPWGEKITYLSLSRLDTYAAAIEANGSPLPDLIGWCDGTYIPGTQYIAGLTNWILTCILSCKAIEEPEGIVLWT